MVLPQADTQEGMEVPLLVATLLVAPALEDTLVSSKTLSMDILLLLQARMGTYQRKSSSNASHRLTSLVATNLLIWRPAD